LVNDITIRLPETLFQFDKIASSCTGALLKGLHLNEGPGREPAYTSEAISKAAQRHGLTGKPFPMPRLGMVNDIWSVGDEFVLRVPTDREGELEMYREVILAPAAFRAGVKTPELVVFDDSRKLLPLAFTVYRRATGETLGTVPRSQVGPMVFRQLGAEIWRLHQGVQHLHDPNNYLPDLLREAWDEELDDRLSVRSAGEQNLVRAWIEKLRPAFQRDAVVVTHNDLHAWNLLVSSDGRELTGILDWSDGGWLDAAADFENLPLLLLPEILRGYRAAGAEPDETLEGRILGRWLLKGLWEASELHEYPQFERTWWCWPKGPLAEAIEDLRSSAEPSWGQWLP
jgi:hygromycin-B 7''-O-kinase